MVGGAIDIEGTNIYTNSGGRISLGIDCKYLATATATSDAVDVDAGAEMDATIQPTDEAKFDKGFKLKFYTDKTWTTGN